MRQIYNVVPKADNAYELRIRLIVMSENIANAIKPGVVSIMNGTVESACDYNRTRILTEFRTD